MVTHDRWFLDAVCERTWEVGDGDGPPLRRRLLGVRAGPGRARPAGGRAEARRQNLLRKELAWLRRGPPARTSKPRFRIEAAQALIADEPPPRDATRLQAFATRRLGKSVYDVEDVTVRVGGRTLLDGVTWRLGPGDRVGLVGVNGSGKTTLLRLLLGEVAPDAGRVRTGSTVRAAYLSQEVRELPGRAAACWRRSRRSPGVADLGGVGADRVPAGRAVRLRRPAGSGPRSPTCPAASGAGCSCSGC